MFPTSSGPTVPAESKLHTRTGIQKALAPIIAAAVKAIPDFNSTSADGLRRTSRALVTIAIRMLFDAGAPPEFVAQQLMLALGTELEDKMKAEKEMGATQKLANA